LLILRTLPAFADPAGYARQDLSNAAPADIARALYGQACPSGFTLGSAGCYWTQTVSGAPASLSWTGLGGNEYELRCANLLQNTNGATNKFWLQFGEGPTPSWQTGASYAWAFDGFDSLAGIQRQGVEGDTGILLNGGFAFNVASYGLSGTWNLHNLQGAVNKQIDGIGQYAKLAAAKSFDAGALTGVYYGDQNAVTAIRLLFTDSGVTLTSGYCTLRYRDN
jgi:hypothetical protein